MSQSLSPASKLAPRHIRMARTGLDMTVRELAERSKVNKATIVRIEAGLPVRDTTLRTVQDVLEAHGARFFESDDTKDVLVGIEVS